MTHRTEVLRGNRLRGALLAAALLILVLPASALADPPATTIDSGPGGLTTDTTPTFGFSTDAGASFECRVDADAFAARSGPGDTRRTTPLADGPHTFQVRAVDAAGPRPDPGQPQLHRRHHPARHVDRPPAPTAARSTDNTPTFGFSAPRRRGELRMPGRRPRRLRSLLAAPATPTPPHRLDDGPHTFEVRAVDAASNPDPTPASRSFTVDTTPPNTSIDSGPSGLTTTPHRPSASPPTTPERALNAGSTPTPSQPARAPATPTPPQRSPTAPTPSRSEPSTRPTTPTRPRPAAASPSTRPPPNTSIDSGPSGLTTDTTPTFGFSSDDAGASFECRVDADAFAACSGPGDTHTTAALDRRPPHLRGPGRRRGRNPDDPGQPQLHRRQRGRPTRPPRTRPSPNARRAGSRPKAEGCQVRVSFRSEKGATSSADSIRPSTAPVGPPTASRPRRAARASSTPSRSGRSTGQATSESPPWSSSGCSVTRRCERRSRNAPSGRAQEPRFRAPGREVVEVDCRRRSRFAFACRFSAGFPGYRLQGTGKVKLGDHLSYRFRVVAQGARFNLTDKNEKPVG